MVELSNDWTRRKVGYTIDGSELEVLSVEAFAPFFVVEVSRTERVLFACGRCEATRRVALATYTRSLDIGWLVPLPCVVFHG